MTITVQPMCMYNHRHIIILLAQIQQCATYSCRNCCRCPRGLSSKLLHHAVVKYCQCIIATAIRTCASNRTMLLFSVIANKLHHPFNKTAIVDYLQSASSYRRICLRLSSIIKLFISTIPQLFCFVYILLSFCIQQNP